MTFYSFMKQMYDARPEHVLFSYDRDGIQTNVTVRQWVQDVADCAEYMAAQYGRNSRTHIAVTGKSSYEWYVLVFGIVLSGNVAVSVNTGLAEEDLLYQLRKSDAVILYREQEERDFEELKKALIPQEGMDDVRKKAAERRNGRLFQEEMLQKEMLQEEWSPDDGASEDRMSLILFSSGTSGLPKGVMLSQKNILAVDDKMEGVFDGGRLMMMLPLHHVAAIYFSIALMRHPVTLCICSSPKYMVRDMKRYRPTVMTMVPAQLAFLVSRCTRDELLRETAAQYLDYVVCGGAMLDNEYPDLFADWGIQVLNAYGLTETSGGITRWFPHRERSIGMLSDANEMKLEEGELLIRGGSVMLGYYKDPAETEKVFRDGWFCTGDLVQTDEDGFLYVTGRKKNIIILSNGENVSPEELEGKICRIPGAEEVVVTGSGEGLTASIYPGEEQDEGKRRRIQEGIRALNERLPRFQQIREVRFREEPFPKTGSGKIRRNL